MTSTILATDSRITYSPGSWKPHSDDTGTVEYTNDAQATAEFTFEGTNVQVLGTLPSQQQSQVIPRSFYSVDNEGGAMFTVPNLDKKNPSPNHIFFQSDPHLRSGNHTLRITNLDDHGILALSAIIFSTSLSSSNSSTSPPDTLQPGDTTTSTISSATFSTPSTSSQSQALASGKKVSVGGIVGGLLAALIVLAALILFLLHRRRKQQRKSRPMVTPFLAPSTTGTPMRSPMYPQERYISPTVGQANFDDIPPSFVAGPSRNAARHGSMYKPRNSIDSLPPSEYGYGAGA